LPELDRRLDASARQAEALAHLVDEAVRVVVGAAMRTLASR
jgi:hypothetical protein